MQNRGSVVVQEKEGKAVTAVEVASPGEVVVDSRGVDEGSGVAAPITEIDHSHPTPEPSGDRPADIFPYGVRGIDHVRTHDHIPTRLLYEADTSFTTPALRGEGEGELGGSAFRGEAEIGTSTHRREGVVGGASAHGPPLNARAVEAPAVNEQWRNPPLLLGFKDLSRDLV